jgi:putative peptide zinc metalloprotease protein
MRRGELIGYALDDGAATVRVIVPQSEIELVRDDTRGVDLRFASDPMDVLHVDQVTREVPTATRQLPSVALATFGGGPIAVDPSDEQHLRALEVVFQVDVKLPEGASDHRIGERVHVRFQHGGRTLAWRISRTVRQLFLRRFDLCARWMPPRSSWPRAASTWPAAPSSWSRAVSSWPGLTGPSGATRWRERWPGQAGP